MDSALQARLAAALAPAYAVEDEIGRGGMAIVYRARDTRLKRGVAVKLLPPELAFRDDIRSRFMREAEMAARLSHPNIVPIYSVDERDGLVYFVMGLVEGESVGDRLRRTGALPVSDARRILREVADALAYAHARGVVHRDIKPDNVLLDAASGRALVTDFGIARAASDDDGVTRLTATGVAIGTPAYMSPEQCAGDRAIDGRSDLYSLGTVAYQMLTGEPPFLGNTPSIMVKHVTERPLSLRQRRADVPEDLERIVMRLLEKDPVNRFANGAALVAALDGAPVAPIVHSPAAERLSREIPTVLRELEQRTRSARSARESRRDRASGRDLPVSERLRKVRQNLVNWAGMSVFLTGINFFTGHGFWWCVFPILGIGLRVGRGVGSLWSDGIPLRDLLTPGTASVIPPAAAALPAGVTDELLHGPFGGVLRQAIIDDKTIKDLLGRLTATERKMLPDVDGVAAALFGRITTLAPALHRLDQQAGAERLPALEERIAQIEQQPGDAADRERRVTLLKRQRDMLADLVRSRTALLEQYESAGLLLQNLSLDLLKVRSSGLDSALSGINSATREARALSREIGYVLSAADELRALENKS